jgi:outer membrane lipoprotein-sorting protein
MKGEQTRWETVEPHRSVMTVDPRGLRIFYPDQKVVEVYDLGDDIRAFTSSPLPRLATLRESFSITRLRESVLGGRDNDPSMLAVELLPRHDRLKERVARVRVLIDSDVPAVRRMEIEDADGERTEIEFTNVEVNVTVDDADVAMALPPGTRTVYPLGEPEANEPTDVDK